MERGNKCGMMVLVKAFKTEMQNQSHMFSI